MSFILVELFILHIDLLGTPVFTKHSLPAYYYTCMLYMLKVLRATSLFLALPL